MKNDNKVEYQEIREYLKKRIPEAEEFMKEIKSKFAPFVINFLKESSKKDLKYLENILNFRLKLVIDNNILFAEINGLIKGKKAVEKCFFYQLALNPSIDFFAPPFLKEEIFAKIDAKFKIEDKPKAIEFAQKLLSRIKIKEAQWAEDWVKAKRKIGHRDPDDIPYLALCFDLKSHGIMSNDKIFAEEQQEFKAWNIKETGKITAEYNEGMVSFFFLGHIPNIATMVHDFISTFFTAVFELVSDFLKIATGILIEGVSYLAKIPSELLMIFGGLFIIAYLTMQEVKGGIDRAFENLKNYLLNLVERLKIWFQKLREFIIKIYKILVPFVKNASYFLAYLIMNTGLAIENINELDKKGNRIKT